MIEIRNVLSKSEMFWKSTEVEAQVGAGIGK